MVSRLQVTYKSPEIDTSLDDKILKIFNILGFTRINQVYNSITFRRDIFFESQGEIDADIEIEKTMKEVCGEGVYTNESSGSKKTKLET